MSIDVPAHPGALWQPLWTLPTWFLQRGYPAALDDSRRWVRVLRMMIVMFLLGMLSGWAYVALKDFIYLTGLSRYVHGIMYRCYSGIGFGLIVLMPLSRWQGRNWWFTAAAVFVSAVFHQLVFSFFMPWVVTQPSWVYKVLAGFIGGLGLGLWMIPPISWRACAFLVLTVAAGIAGYFTTYLMNDRLGEIFDSTTMSPYILSEYLLWYLRLGNLYSPFNCFVAMTLGLRLAWGHPTNRSPI